MHRNVPERCSNAADTAPLQSRAALTSFGTVVCWTRIKFRKSAPIASAKNVTRAQGVDSPKITPWHQIQWRRLASKRI